MPPSQASDSFDNGQAVIEFYMQQELESEGMGQLKHKNFSFNEKRLAEPISFNNSAGTNANNSSNKAKNQVMQISREHDNSDSLNQRESNPSEEASLKQSSVKQFFAGGVDYSEKDRKSGHFRIQGSPTGVNASGSSGEHKPSTGGFNKSLKKTPIQSLHVAGSQELEKSFQEHRAQLQVIISPKRNNLLRSPNQKVRHLKVSQNQAESNDNDQ